MVLCNLIGLVFTYGICFTGYCNRAATYERFGCNYKEAKCCGDCCSDCCKKKKIARLFFGALFCGCVKEEEEKKDKYFINEKRNLCFKTTNSSEELKEGNIIYTNLFI